MDFNRYERHLIIPEIGDEAQKLILNSSVLVIGAGGLGSPAAIYLAANGIGKLGIVDYDKVDITNLNRQILYETNDINKNKVSLALEKLSKINPELEISGYNIKLTESNIESIIKDYDFIIDAVDNIETKLLINDTCVKLKKPFNHSGINKFAGSSITVLPGKTACLRCIFKNIKNTQKHSAGIFGPVAGILGTIQAAEALKYCGTFGNLLTNKFLYLNIYTLDFRINSVGVVDKCNLCERKKNETINI